METGHSIVSLVNIRSYISEITKCRSSKTVTICTIENTGSTQRTQLMTDTNMQVLTPSHCTLLLLESVQMYPWVNEAFHYRDPWPVPTMSQESRNYANVILSFDLINRNNLIGEGKNIESSTIKRCCVRRIRVTNRSIERIAWIAWNGITLPLTDIYIVVDPLVIFALQDYLEVRFSGWRRASYA